MDFSGPNGQVSVALLTSRADGIFLTLESLVHFDTSKTEQLKIDFGKSPSGDLPYQALLPMGNLRTLTLRECIGTYNFVHALHPSMNLSGVVVCPKLEELVIVLYDEGLDIKHVIGTAAARASRGAKLRSVRIVGRNRAVRARRDVLELKKHVFHVEC